MALPTPTSTVTYEQDTTKLDRPIYRLSVTTVTDIDDPVKTVTWDRTRVQVDQVEEDRRIREIIDRLTARIADLNEQLASLQNPTPMEVKP